MLLEAATVQIWILEAEAVQMSMLLEAVTVQISILDAEAARVSMLLEAVPVQISMLLEAEAVQIVTLLKVLLLGWRQARAALIRAAMVLALWTRY